MPCTYYEPDYTQQELKEIREEKNTVTRLACDRCKELEIREGRVPDWAVKWWKKHKQLDAKREAASLKRQKEIAIRVQALSKLTKEERNELGV